MMNDPVLDDLVSPEICKNLFIAGLKVPTPFYWEVIKNEARLRTNYFDPDKYYKSSTEHIAYINNVRVDELPAFFLGDMQRIIPDYILSRTGNQFTLSVESMYDLPTVTNNRLADAFATMVLEGLRKRIIVPLNVIELFINKM